MNILSMVYKLRDEIRADYEILINQADVLESLPDANGQKHSIALNDRCDTLLNQLYLLEKSIKKYGRRTKEYAADTFSGLIDLYVKEPETLESDFFHSELLSIATDKKTNELYELHQYEDGSLDPPILNWESSKQLKEKEDAHNEQSRANPVGSSISESIPEERCSTVCPPVTKGDDAGG